MANNIVSVQVKGLDDLERKLYELPSTFARRAMRQAIGPAIQIWKDEIQRGALQGEYETGFMASQVATKIKTSARDEQGPGMVGFTWKQNPAKTQKHVPSANDEARWKELGTAKEPARPFIRPAFEAKAGAVLDLFTGELKRLLTEVFGT
jgi:HK97 gp10 family phage protein